MENPKPEFDLMSLFQNADRRHIVKALMVLRDISQTELSITTGIATSELSRVISGKRRTRHIRQKVAEALGVPENLLFSVFDGHTPRSGEK